MNQLSVRTYERAVGRFFSIIDPRFGATRVAVIGAMLGEKIGAIKGAVLVGMMSLLGSGMALSHPALPLDEVNAFTQPDNSSWAAWQRGDSGSVYAGWDIFEANPDPVFGNDSTPDGYVTMAEKQVDINALPAFTQFGTAPSAALPGVAEAQIIATAGLGIFRTSTSNWYSFSDTPDFNLILLTDTDHQNLSGPVRVALQLAILGSDIDDSTLALVAVDHDGQSGTAPIDITFTSKETLFTGETIDGDGNPVPDGAKEYLYLFDLDFAQPNYQLHISAQGSSLSLDAIAIDVGPAPAVVAEHNVPMLPIPLTVLLAAGLLVASIVTRRQRMRII